MLTRRYTAIKSNVDVNYKLREMTMAKKIGKRKMTECFAFLDSLRESGITNMFGAAPYVMNACGLGREDASKVVGAWMRTFSKEKSPADRAKEHLTQASS